MTRSLLSMLLVLSFLAGCGRRAAPAQRERVVLTAVQNPHGAVLHVAAARGAFAQAGLDVVLQPHPFGKRALEALLEGRADLATCADTPFVLAVLNQQDVVVLASLSTSARDCRVIARKGAGIHEAGQLAGKTVGVTFGTSGDYFLDSLLVRNRVPRNSVRRVNLDPSQMAEALATGQVDAVSTWIPHTLRLRERFGDEVMTFSAEDVCLQSFVLVGRRSYVAAHRDTVERVLRALGAAEGFLRREPETARQLVAQSINMPPADVAQVWADFDFQVRLEQRHLVIMNEEARWALRSGMAPAQAVPNFLTKLEPGPLEAVDPRAVRLMR